MTRRSGPEKIRDEASRPRPTIHDQPLPIFGYFPMLARLPRVPLGVSPTPVVPLDALSSSLWIKRDDLSGAPVGGNKTRALEFLLGGVRRGERVVTVGAAGSTHALSLAIHGASPRIGARVFVGRWRQEMNETARRVAKRTETLAEHAPVFRTLAQAYLWAWWQRARGARWIPAGGSTPLGVLGHVNAGLELVGQVDAGDLPLPAEVVVPLGTGGTAAGLALAFAIAGRDVGVVGARVVPSLVGRRGRVLRLAHRTARLIEGLSGRPVPRVAPSSVRVANEAYGGAYGRETPAARAAADRLRAATGLALDPTYSAKGFSVALERASRHPTLFWLTFDARLLGEGSADQ